HVARRASKAQGIALLTLYSKGFSRPKCLPDCIADDVRIHESRLSTLLDKYKLLIRKEEAPGHLPICWGMLTGALGLTLGQSYQRLLLQCIYILNTFEISSHNHQSAHSISTCFYMLAVFSQLLCG